MIKKSLIFMTLTTLIYSNELIKAEVKKENDGIVIEISKSNKFKNTKAPKKNSKKHLIKKDETLNRIASKYKKKVTTIAKDNKIKNIDLIFEGKTLTIN